MECGCLYLLLDVRRELCGGRQQEALGCLDVGDKGLFQAGQRDTPWSRMIMRLEATRVMPSLLVPMDASST